MIVDPANIRLYITPTSAVSCVVNTGNRKSARLVKSYKENFEKIRTDNLLSINGARKVRKAINWLVHTSREKRVYSKEMGKYIKYRLTFITLTLPSKQVHPDEIIKKEVLGVFIQWMRDRHEAKKYIWRAEIQKNGNIHFHITTDKFIYHKSVRRQWNKNLEKLGYISRFEAAHGHRQPPSTEIKAVKKVKNIAAYLTEYLSKAKGGSGKKVQEEYNNRVISGHLYGISSYLGRIKPFTVSADVGDFFDVLRKLRAGAEKVIVREFATIYVFSKEFVKRFIYFLSNIYGGEFIQSTGLDRLDLKKLLLRSI